MQTVWKGSISFGLVSIPVRLVSATEQRDLTFHQVRASDGSRVRYRRVAEADGEEVPYADIAKSYTTPDGREVVLTDDDLASVRIPSGRTVELVGFVDGAEIDPINLSKSYFAEPAAEDRKPYALLRDALVDSGRVAVVKISMRNRERLAVLRPREDVLVLQTMLWPDEIRTPDFATDAGSAVRPQELAMAESYIDALTGELDLSDQSDGYRQALGELVAARAEGVEPTVPDDDEAGPGGQVVDLMEALRRSVEAAGGRSGVAGGPVDGAGASDRAGADAAGAVPAGKGAGGNTTGATGTGAKTTGAKSTGAKATGVKSTGAKGTGRRGSARGGAGAAEATAERPAARKRAAAAEPGSESERDSGTASGSAARRKPVRRSA